MEIFNWSTQKLYLNVWLELSKWLIPSLQKCSRSSVLSKKAIRKKQSSESKCCRLSHWVDLLIFSSNFSSSPDLNFPRRKERERDREGGKMDQAKLVWDREGFLLGDKWQSRAVWWGSIGNIPWGVRGRVKGHVWRRWRETGAGSSR